MLWEGRALGGLSSGSQFQTRVGHRENLGGNLPGSPLSTCLDRLLRQRKPRPPTQEAGKPEAQGKAKVSLCPGFSYWERQKEHLVGEPAQGHFWAYWLAAGRNGDSLGHLRSNKP